MFLIKCGKKSRLAWFKTSSPHVSHQHRNFGVSCILDSPIDGGFLNLGLKQDAEFKQIFKGDKYGEGFWWFKQGGMNFWMWPTKHGDCDSI